MSLGGWYIADMCKWPHEGQEFAFTGGVYKTFISMVTLSEDFRDTKYTPLFKLYRSYYV